MNIKLLKLRLSQFFRQRSHGPGSSDNISELVEPESKSGRAESAIDVILRWADDGAQILDLGHNSGTGKKRMNVSGKER